MVAVNVFGEWMVKRRESLGFKTRKKFYVVAGVSEAVCQQLELGKGLPFHERTQPIKVSIASALQAEVLELDRFSEGDAPAPEIGKPKERGRRMRIDTDVYTGDFRESRFFDIPEYDLLTSAGHWSELSESETKSLEHDPRVIDQGLFRIRIHGDCMAPRWVTGEVIEFKIWRQGSEPVPIGEDVALTNSEGMATFKTLIGFDEATEEYVLRARNTKKFPKEIRVSEQMVSRIAVAQHAIVKKPK